MPCLARVFLFTARRMSSCARSCVPKSPVIQKLRERPPVTVDLDTIHLLEKLSLVRFGDAEAVARLEEAITFAQAIFDVDTTNVKPLYSILEDQNAILRDDVAEDFHSCEVLSNAALMEEGYIVAPPGNIPLEKDESIEKFKS